MNMITVTRNYTDYEGYKTGRMVCNGYSMATFLLLSNMGIPVRIVNGVGGNVPGPSNYSWNVVKVDGNWYNMDATWDDKGAKRWISYTYFLKSDADFPKHIREELYAYDGKIAKDSYIWPYQVPGQKNMAAYFG